MKFIKLCALWLMAAAFFAPDVYAAPDTDTYNVNYGGAIRARHEYWKNLFDMDNDLKDNRDFFRVKSSVWAEQFYTEDLKFYIKLTNEFKKYRDFERANQEMDTDFDWDEVVFDNLYAEMKNIGELPLDIKAGRFDLLGTYGEGFLIMDGTPLDGSRTFYFNGAVATWHVDDENTIDILYFNNPQTDDFLPVMAKNDPEQQLNATDEQAAGLYWKGKPAEDLNAEAYYIYKQEDEGGPLLQAQETKLSTVGTFMKYMMDPWAVRGQAAYQFGDYGDYDRDGFGGYLYLDRDFKDAAWSPKASVGYAYLSGDDPSTSDNEGWDPLFSRYPWISELYVLSFSPESGVGYWTNLQLLRAELAVKPCEKSKVSLWYNYLMANENPVGSIFDDGNSRGHLPQARFDYAFTKNVCAYVLAEYFIPGDFYVDSSEEALFTRVELLLKF